MGPELYARRELLDDPVLDGYAQRGVALSRDAAHRIIPSLYRDAWELRARGGDANNAEAELLLELASQIGKALNA